jgi:colicin import membrane protein
MIVNGTKEAEAEAEKALEAVASPKAPEVKKEAPKAPEAEKAPEKKKTKAQEAKEAKAKAKAEAEAKAKAEKAKADKEAKAEADKKAKAEAEQKKLEEFKAIKVGTQYKLYISEEFEEETIEVLKNTGNTIICQHVEYEDFTKITAKDFVRGYYTKYIDNKQEKVYFKAV